MLGPKWELNVCMGKMRDKKTKKRGHLILSFRKIYNQQHLRRRRHFFPRWQKKISLAHLYLSFALFCLFLYLFSIVVPLFLSSSSSSSTIFLSLLFLSLALFSLYLSILLFTHFYSCLSHPPTSFCSFFLLYLILCLSAFMYFFSLYSSLFYNLLVSLSSKTYG